MITRTRVLLVVVAGCSSLPDPVDVATKNPDPLRQLAGDFLLGTAIDNKPYHVEPLYKDIAAYQFNLVVSENEMKMAAIRPTESTWDFSAGDDLVQWAAAHAMKVRGHTLVYPNGSPRWLLDITDAATLEAAIKTHITTTMQHFAGEVIEWDVVNEPYDYDASKIDPATQMPYPPAPDNKIFTKLLTEQYIDTAMATARAADPSAKLFINENGIELPGPKLDALAAKVASLKANDAIDGVGMEFHVPLASVDDTTVSQVACAMKQLTDLGVEIHVTELDVRIETPATDADLAKQCQVYAGILDACRSNPRCTGFVVWGFSDRWSWIPDHFSGFGEADLLDDRYAFKPAYGCVQDALRVAPSGITCP